MSVEDAVHEVPEGVALDLEVTPGASRTRFPAGHNPWRRRIEAKVAAPASEGRANDALLEAVAQFFRLPRAHVEILRGAMSRQKRVLLRGARRAEVLQQLAQAEHGSET